VRRGGWKDGLDGLIEDAALKGRRYEGETECRDADLKIGHYRDEARGRTEVLPLHKAPERPRIQERSPFGFAQGRLSTA